MQVYSKLSLKTDLDTFFQEDRRGPPHHSRTDCLTAFGGPEKNFSLKILELRIALQSELVADYVIATVLQFGLAPDSNPSRKSSPSGPFDSCYSSTWAL